MKSGGSPCDPPSTTDDMQIVCDAPICRRGHVLVGARLAALLGGWLLVVLFATSVFPAATNSVCTASLASKMTAADVKDASELYGFPEVATEEYIRQSPKDDSLVREVMRDWECPNDGLCSAGHIPVYLAPGDACLLRPLPGCDRFADDFSLKHHYLRCVTAEELKRLVETDGKCMNTNDGIAAPLVFSDGHLVCMSNAARSKYEAFSCTQLTEASCNASVNRPGVVGQAAAVVGEQATLVQFLGYDCPTSGFDRITGGARWLTGTFGSVVTYSDDTLGTCACIDIWSTVSGLNDTSLPHCVSDAKTLEDKCPKCGTNGCHPPDARVELSSGETERLDALEVGALIRTPSGFEPVVGFLHADPNMRVSYHVFRTDQATMRISDRHFLFVDGVETDPAEVTIGQTLFTSSSGPQVIRAVGKETRLGAYHIVVPSGSYYVDGALASTFVSYIPHFAWKIFGDGYITLRFKLGLPITPDGQTPVTLFWLLDLMRFLRIPYAVQSALLWPLIAGSVMVTELACSVARALLLSEGVLAHAGAAALLASLTGSKRLRLQRSAAARLRPT